jgi:hypothetical protein
MNQGAFQVPKNQVEWVFKPQHFDSANFSNPPPARTFLQHAELQQQLEATRACNVMEGGLGERSSGTWGLAQQPDSNNMLSQASSSACTGSEASIPLPLPNHSQKSPVPIDINEFPHLTSSHQDRPNEIMDSTLATSMNPAAPHQIPVYEVVMQPLNPSADFSRLQVRLSDLRTVLEEIQVGHLDLKQQASRRIWRSRKISRYG